MSALDVRKEQTTLEQMVLISLIRAARKRAMSSIIRFPDVFSRICPLLCIKKAEAWQLLGRLADRGTIEIVPFHGIRIMQEK